MVMVTGGVTVFSVMDLILRRNIPNPPEVADGKVTDTAIAFELAVFAGLPVDISTVKKLQVGTITVSSYVLNTTLILKQIGKPIVTPASYF